MKNYLVIMLLFLSVNLLADNDKKEKFDFKKNTEVHYVKNNETLARIALKNNVSVAFLLHINNKIYDPNLIRIGQSIRVPNEKARNYVQEKSKSYIHLVEKMGAMTYKERNKAMKEMIEKDWLVIPVLLKALDHKDVEIRENAREALREIHKKKVAIK